MLLTRAQQSARRETSWAPLATKRNGVKSYGDSLTKLQRPHAQHSDHYPTKFGTPKPHKARVAKSRTCHSQQKWMVLNHARTPLKRQGTNTRHGHHYLITSGSPKLDKAQSAKSRTRHQQQKEMTLSHTGTPL